MKIYPENACWIEDQSVVKPIVRALESSAKHGMQVEVGMGPSSLVRALLDTEKVIQVAVVANENGEDNVVIFEYPVKSDGKVFHPVFDKDRGLPYVEITDCEQTGGEAE